MAITKNVYNSETNTYERKTLHVGRVLSVYNKDYRAMSDVYTLATFATIWNDDLEIAQEVFVNAYFELDMTEGVAEVDAAQSVVALYGDYIKRLEEERRVKEQELWAQRAAAAELAEKNRPVKGKMMRVVRGRKVKKGTVGRVFWVRDGRVGLDVTGKTDARGYTVDPVWVSAEYLETV